MFEPIQTPYGTALRIQGANETGILVALPKQNMTTPHPDYRNGPCVNFIYFPGESRMKKILTAQVTA